MTANALTEILSGATAVVAFTGAGISTESGIPDFRSPGGVWTRHDPRDFTFDRYVDSAEVRSRSWQMRREFLAMMPSPNRGHRALVTLEERGQLIGVVTQNIDGLHQMAGSRRVVELHGNVREVVCIGVAPRGGVPHGCGFSTGHRWVLDQLDGGDPDPHCPDCGGIVKTATISFGQAMPTAAMDEAAVLVGSADVLLVLGSSLEVYPAAGFPDEARRAGATVVIVNRDPTDADDLAHLVIHDEIGRVLEHAVAGLT